MLRPYTPSGRLDPASLLRGLVFAASVAIAAGMALGFVGGWFRLIIVWPFILGFAAGAGASRGIRVGKLRAPVAAGLLGLVAAGAGVLAEQGFAYHRTRGELRKHATGTPDEVERGIDLALVAHGGAETEAEAAQAFERLEAGPPPGALEVWRGWLGLRWRTTSISSRGGKPMELGRTGGMLLWLVEALIVLGCGAGTAWASAWEPFCEDCVQWFSAARPIALIQPHWKAEVVRALEATDDEALARLVNAAAGGPPCVQLDLRRCECPAGAPFVEAHEVTLDREGKRATKRLAGGLTDSKVLGGAPS